MMATVTVRATTPGFYGGFRRREGAIFTLLPGHKPGKWMEVIPDAAPVVEVKRRKITLKENPVTPTALSELQ
jgi:molybdopterin/thiamine biosynthesis adenylyltransferase